MTEPANDLEVIIEPDVFPTMIQELEDDLVLIPVIGPTGPAGPAGDGGYSHLQTSPSADWQIEHGLGRHPSSISIWIDGAQVYPDVYAPDTERVYITFPQPESGRAEII